MPIDEPAMIAGRERGVGSERLRRDFVRSKNRVVQQQLALEHEEGFLGRVVCVSVAWIEYSF